MFEQALDTKKGWFQMAALDKSAPLGAALLAGATAVPAGRVASLDTNGEFQLGNGSLATAMPIYLWNAKGDLDVSNDGTSPTTGTVHWVAIAPTGIMSGLVATGGYELQTTEFDTDQTYALNDLLTADVSGVMTNVAAVQFTNWICGVCSSHNQAEVEADPGSDNPVGTNANGVDVLNFWSYFLPAAP
jgi:L-ascorbate metabolism protein UlaG (beta-lactamase superfamily)